MQDYQYNWVQRSRADSAWRQSYGTLNTQFTKDYREGWKVGYTELSTGGCDEPPPVPPRKYWAAAYQSAEGKCCIDEWYNGWRDGAVASKACGNGEWHKIMTAPTVPQVSPPAQNTGPGTFVNPQAARPLLPSPLPRTESLQPQPVSVSVPGFESEESEPEVREGVNADHDPNEGTQRRVGDNYSVPLRGVHPSPVVTMSDDAVNPVSTTSEESTEVPYGSAVEVFVEGVQK